MINTGLTYPPNLEEKLQFKKIKDLILSECRSDLGREWVDQMSFSNDFDEVNTNLSETEEARQILVQQLPFPKTDYVDQREVLKRLKVEGTYFSEEELFEFYLSFRTIGRIFEFFEDFGEPFKWLPQNLDGKHFDHYILNEIELILDERGKIRDNASPKLALIRKERRDLEDGLRKKIDRSLKKAISNGYTEEGALPTIRDGRLVIPVHAENKRMIQGFIHGESATGQTVFLEPAEILGINNEVKDLIYQENREIQKILFAITERIRPNLFSVQELYSLLGKFDFLLAKASIAASLGGQLPKLTASTKLTIKEATHPLLKLSFQEQGKKVVPLSLELDNEQRVVLISGPNAGGKSVALKTVVLLQYMLQSGLLVPVHPSSEFGVFDKIFIDIGDEQSIENDLSTYSSHLANMKYFTKHANEKCLVAIDEFGSGTEPQFGGAIAEAILEQLLDSNCYGVITTHYSNLKKFAEDSEGIINGAMLFDLKDMKPLYELEIGHPGSSFALEIAGKMGFGKDFLNVIQKKLGFSQVKYEKLLGELETEKRILQDKIKRYDSDKQLLKKRINEYEELREHLEKERKKIITRAKSEAAEILKDSRREVENVIREIKEANADKKKTRQLREKLDERRENLTSSLNIRKDTLHSKNNNYQIGDKVRVLETGAVGEILSVSTKEIEISIGNLKTRLKPDRIEKVGQKHSDKFRQTEAQKASMDLNPSKADFETQLNIRGLKPEEAMPELEAYIDRAHLFGISEVTVLHGKGQGVLRNMTREYLKKLNFVDSAKDAHVDHGGAGLTVVKLK